MVGAGRTWARDTGTTTATSRSWPTAVTALNSPKCTLGWLMLSPHRSTARWDPLDRHERTEIPCLAGRRAVSFVCDAPASRVGGRRTCRAQEVRTLREPSGACDTGFRLRVAATPCRQPAGSPRLQRRPKATTQESLSGATPRPSLPVATKLSTPPTRTFGCARQSTSDDAASAACGDVRLSEASAHRNDIRATLRVLRLDLSLKPRCLRRPHPGRNCSLFDHHQRSRKPGALHHLWADCIFGADRRLSRADRPQESLDALRRGAVLHLGQKVLALAARRS